MHAAILLFFICLYRFIGRGEAQAPNATLSDADTCLQKIAAVSASLRSTINSTLANKVGIGWDDLLSVPTGQVFAQTFNECQVSPDGYYLVPDGVTVVLVQTTKLDSMARFYHNFEEFSREVTQKRGVNANAKYVTQTGIEAVKISGSYSDMHQEVRQMGGAWRLNNYYRSYSRRKRHATSATSPCCTPPSLNTPMI